MQQGRQASDAEEPAERDGQLALAAFRLLGSAALVVTAIALCYWFWPSMRWAAAITLTFWFVTLPLALLAWGRIERDLGRVSRWRPLAIRLDRWALSPTARAPGFTWRDLLVIARNLLITAVVLSPIVIYLALFLWGLLGGTHNSPYESAADVEHCLGCP
jgi:fatty acid desaturase